MAIDKTECVAPPGLVLFLLTHPSGFACPFQNAKPRVFGGPVARLQGRLTSRRASGAGWTSVPEVSSPENYSGVWYPFRFSPLVAFAPAGESRNGYRREKR